MNVDLCDFFQQVALDTDLMDRLSAMPTQNRLAASRALSRVAEDIGLQIPAEDFFPVLNIPPTARSENEWEILTAHVDMHTPIQPEDTRTVMDRVHVIIERQRIKVFEAKLPGER